MRYNMDFLVAALIFLIVLWHHFMKQRQYAGNKTEKTFQIFMMLGIGDILLDMVSTVVIDNSRPEFARMLYVILLLFYLCQLLIPPVLYLYTLALAGWSVEEKLSGIRCLLLLPTVVLTVLVMGNFQTGLLFSVTANGAYIRGPLYLMMYMQAVWYGLVIGGESIRNYQKLGKRKFGIIWEILFIMVSCVLLQVGKAGILSGNSFYYGQLCAVAGILSGSSADRICYSTLSDGSAACFSEPVCVYR